MSGGRSRAGDGLFLLRLGGIFLAVRGLGILLHRFGVLLCGLGVLLGAPGVLAGGRFRALVLEVGHIPAAAFQLEAGGADELLERRFAALRTLGAERIAHFLQIFSLETARFASVFVNRHAR